MIGVIYRSRKNVTIKGSSVGAELVVEGLGEHEVARREWR